jgi:fermentation-respiration switch protein FrsA (DUF1100 family)
MVRILGVLLALLFVAYAAVVLLFALAQRRLQYIPSHEDPSGKGTERFRPWRGPSGELFGYLHGPAKPARVLLFFHGNGGEALHRDWVAPLAGEETLVALVEYPGYGARPGSPSETGLFAAATAAYDLVTAAHPGVPVVAMGESLGTGVASFLASQRPVERLALVSPFTSIGDVAVWHYPWLPVRWLLRDRYESARWLAEARVPLQVVHGDRDDIVPIRFAEALVAGYPGKPKALTRLEGAGHNDLVPALLNRPEAENFRRFVRGE